MSTKQEKKKDRRVFSAEEKCQAVLSVWSERRTIAEVCLEMEISYPLLAKWQSTALDAMVSAFTPKETAEALSPMLSKRLDKLLTKRLDKRSKKGNGKLDQRLSSVQAKE